MIKRTINVLILALFAYQTVHVFGELLVMRWLKNVDLYEDSKAVICMSQDDGSALAYIHDDDYELFNSDLNAKKFYDTCKYPNMSMVCNTDDDEMCLPRWDREGWQLTDSMNTPMGPVFDRRWEAFTEYGSDIEYNISLSNVSQIVVPFSVRAKSDVNILICKDKYKTSLCYWIIISGWNNTRSAIRKCSTGVSSIGKYFQNNSECTEHVYLNHKALSWYEWRTFILMWNSATRNISLYDPDKLIMSYKDTEDYENSNIFHGISFSTQNHSFIRYHNYTFLYTRNYTSILSSPRMLFKNSNICLQLLIGLCATCEATIALIDIISLTRNIIGSVVVNGSSTAHGLPMWQFITIKSLSVASYNRIKIEVIPRYNIPNSNPLWAIAYIRGCVPKKCLRKTRTISYKKLLPHLMLCQKLFYQEQSVVDLLSDAKVNEELDDENCDLAYFIPECVFRCELFPKIPKNPLECIGVTICNKYSCTCTPGYQGSNCNQPCNKGLYGYGCKKKCGSCHQNEPCGPTGECPTGCKNRANYTYVPPFCHIGFDNLDKPEIIFTNQTTIVATAQIKWKAEYKKKKLLYSFHIELLDGRLLDGRSVYWQEWKPVFEDTTLIGIFEDLEPDTSYKIKYMLSIAQSEITSEWKTVETNCDLPYAPRNFTYSFKSNGAIDLKWLYPWKTCGLDLCCFCITIQGISSNLRSNISHASKYEIFENAQTHNTHKYTKRLYLLPSTLYNISIQTVAIRNETSHTNSLEFTTPSSVGLNGQLEVLTQKSDSKIMLRIPKVLNDTRDSVTYIVIISPNICEQNVILPKHLLTHIGEKKMKRVWQVVKRPTNEMANDAFISDNQSANCPLKNGELYEIVIIITESEFSGDRVMFIKEIPFYFGGPPPTYFEVWFICVILILSGLSAVFYYYKK